MTKAHANGADDHAFLFVYRLPAAIADDVLKPENLRAIGVVFNGEVELFVRVVIELFGEHVLPRIGGARLTLGNGVAVHFVAAILFLQHDESLLEDKNYCETPKVSLQGLNMVFDYKLPFMEMRLATRTYIFHKIQRYSCDLFHFNIDQHGMRRIFHPMMFLHG